MTDDRRTSSNQMGEVLDQETSRNRHEQGQQAIKRLQGPILGLTRAAQALTVISDVLAVAPFMALVALGDVLLAAHDNGRPVDADQVGTITFWLVTAFCTKLLFYFAALLVTHLADLRLRAMMRRQIVDRLSRAPLSWFAESSSGAVRKAVQDDTNTVHTVIAHGPIERLNAVAAPLFLWIYAMVIDWRLGLLAISTIPLYVLTYSQSLKGMSEKTAQMDDKLAAVSSSMVEFAAGIGVVKAFGRVGQAHERYRTAAKEFNAFYLDWCKPLVTVSCLAMAWIEIPVLLLVNLGGGALMVNAGWVSIPQVLATTLIALTLPEAIATVASLTWAYQLAGSAAVRLCELLDTPTLPQTDSPQQPAGSQIDIRNVSHSYHADDDEHRVQALSNASLRCAAGSVTALVGPSGSGKSTLGMLVARFADPDSGAIQLGGVDLRQMSEKTLYDNVSFVLQDPQLLATSVHANIALAKPGATLEEVRAAARVAQIDDHIMGLPHGYDTVLGSQTHLSGGQEQRIAIARAVLRDTPVLVLDEATAMTDPESESEIQRALTQLAQGRTVLVIAHRPASIAGADQIVVMERGRISVTGTHAELLDDPHYSALVQQSSSPTTSEVNHD